MLNILEQAEEWGVTDMTNLPDEKWTKLEDAQEDLQYHLGELGPLLSGFVGNDDTITTEEGNTFELPKQASSGNNNASFPNN